MTHRAKPCGTPLPPAQVLGARLTWALRLTSLDLAVIDAYSSNSRTRDRGLLDTVKDAVGTVRACRFLHGAWEVS